MIGSIQGRRQGAQKFPWGAFDTFIYHHNAPKLTYNNDEILFFPDDDSRTARFKRRENGI
jgi:hypothetical protein